MPEGCLDEYHRVEQMTDCLIVSQPRVERLPYQNSFAPSQSAKNGGIGLADEQRSPLGTSARNISQNLDKADRSADMLQRLVAARGKLLMKAANSTDMLQSLTSARNQSLIHEANGNVAMALRGCLKSLADANAGMKSFMPIYVAQAAQTTLDPSAVPDIPTYLQIVGMYSQYSQDFHNAVNQIQGCISADSDSGYVDVDVDKARDIINGLTNQAQALSVTIPASQLTQWETALGVDPSNPSVPGSSPVIIVPVPGDDAHYNVEVNTKDINSLETDVDGLTGTPTSDNKIRVKKADASKFVDSLGANEGTVEKGVETLVGSPLWNSDYDIITSEVKVIEQANGELTTYQQIVAMYTDYFEDFIDKVNDIRSCVTADSDSNYMDVNVNKALQDTKDLRDDAKKLSVTIPASQLKEWETELGVDPNDMTSTSGSSPVIIEPVPGDDAHYKVEINTKEIDSLENDIKGVANSGSSVKINSALGSGFINSLDTVKGNVQNDVQTLVTKFSNRQSSFDNLVKVLSSSISSFSDVWKSYLQF